MDSSLEREGAVGHVLDVVADYLEDRMPPAAAAAVRAHLAGCAECAAGFRWAEDLRGKILALGLRHLSPERIVALGDGEAASSEEESHLNACAACRRELDWAWELPVPPSLAATERGTLPLGKRGAVGPGSLSSPLEEAVRLLRSLARLSPLPVHFARGTAFADRFEETLAMGLDLYAGGDYPGSESHLARAAELRPGDAEVELYLGSVRLLQGRLDDAMRSFERAAERAPRREIKEECLWQLAQACLAAGRGVEAERALRAVVDLDSARRQESAEILGRLAALRGSRESRESRESGEVDPERAGQ